MIQVSDLGDSGERVTFAWHGKGPARMSTVPSAARPVVLTDNSPPVTGATVPAAPPPAHSGSETKQSRSGKLSVTAIYNYLMATVSVDVASDLKGPFEIKVTGGAPWTREVEVHTRGNASFLQDLSLAA